MFPISSLYSSPLSLSAASGNASFSSSSSPPPSCPSPPSSVSTELSLMNNQSDINCDNNSNIISSSTSSCNNNNNHYSNKRKEYEARKELVTRYPKPSSSLPYSCPICGLLIESTTSLTEHFQEELSIFRESERLAKSTASSGNKTSSFLFMNTWSPPHPSHSRLRTGLKEVRAKRNERESRWSMKGRRERHQETQIMFSPRQT